MNMLVNKAGECVKAAAVVHVFQQAFFRYIDAGLNPVNFISAYQNIIFADMFWSIAV
jgi:hypothetical protein